MASSLALAGKLPINSFFNSVPLREYRAVIAKSAAKKNPAEAGFFVSVYPIRSRSGGGNAGRLEAFGAVLYLKGDRLTFVQGFET